MQDESCPLFPGLLEAVLKATNQGSEPEDVLPAVLCLVCDATGWSIGHALVPAAGGAQLHSAGIWYAADQPPPAEFAAFQRATEARRYTKGEGLPGGVLADGRPSWITDFREAADYPLQRLARTVGLEACLAFPVRSRDRVVGVLEFYARRPGSPGPDLLEIMDQVGIQLGYVFARASEHRELVATLRRMRQLLDCAADAFMELDGDGRVIEWNQAAVAMFGWSREEMIGRSVVDAIVPPQYRDAHQEILARVLTSGTSFVNGKLTELSALDSRGQEFPIELTRWSFQDGDDWRFYASVRDITEREKLRKQLEQQAYHDPLTGLPNRALALDRLGQLLKRRDSRQGGPAVLFVDLDYFKKVNDSVGHDAGDRVLVAVAARFRQVVRSADTVARLAGDEFLIVCPDVGTRPAAELVAERTLAALKDSVQVHGDSVFLTASIGVALATEDSSPESLISSADIAMYHAKRAGRACYEFFDQRMRQAAASRLRTENELHEALERGQLRLYFQPIVNADDATTVAVEALLRWQHPSRGLLLPRDFMPIAEQTGLIVPIGAWAIREACRHAEQWCRSGALELPLCASVNLSARQLAQSDLVSTVDRILTAADLDPSRVEFGIEVTETVAMRNVVAATKTLQALHALGVRLSIDDFGTGYASLAYLKHLSVNTLKVDRSFVQQIATNPIDRAIVSTITGLGRSLGLAVVAEGVEKQEQADVLRDIGITLLQGFLYARPQPPEELLQTLARRRQSPDAPHRAVT